MRFVRRIKRKKKEEKIHCASRSRSDTETVKRIVRRIPLDLQSSSSLASLEVFKHFSTQTIRSRYSSYDLKIEKREKHKRDGVSLRQSQATMICHYLLRDRARFGSFIRLLLCVLMIGSHYSSLLTFTRT